MRPPNLLFIITDQHRFDTLAAYGNHQIKMPNLNRLASQSYVFKKAYVTQPVCGPARSSILTGTYPHWNGVLHNDVPLRPGIPCLPSMITEGDYIKAYHGRTGHLWDAQGEAAPNDDLHEREIFSHPPYDYLVQHGIRPVNGKNFTNEDRPLFPESLSGPAYLAELSSGFVRKNRDRPFLLFCSIYEPHGPYSGPFDGMYDPSEVTLPDNFSAIPTPDQPLATRLEQRYIYENGHQVPLRTDQDWRELTAKYWGLCTLVDKYVGKILNTLEECGLLDNTIIVFTADHGDMLGSHRLLAKNVMFEESARVPLLLHLPGQTATREITGPVSHIDLIPTILDLMGQPIASHLQGKSLRPVLRVKATTLVIWLLSGPGSIISSLHPSKKNSGQITWHR